MECVELMKFGIFDKFSTFTSDFHYKHIKSFFSSFQFSSRQQAEAKAAELGLDVLDVLGLNFNGQSSSSNFDLWQQELQKSSFQEAVTAGLKTETVERISTALTDLVKTCLTQKGLHAFVIPSSDQQNFTFTLDFVPSSSTKPTAKGSFTITPSSVASTASPQGLLDKDLEIGPQGVSISLKRLPTDTVQLTYNTDEGSGVIRYDAIVTPPVLIEFKALDTEIPSGGSTKLVWDVRNAQRVEIEGKGQVNTSGALTVSPTTTTDFRLRAISLDGQVVSAFATVTVRPPPPVLTAASVFFHTTDDDKDDDTTVTVNLVFGGSTVATVSGTFGKFNDNSDSGRIGLNIIERPRKDALIGNSQVQLIESPVGHDEWHFNWAIELSFSDGTSRRFDLGAGDVDFDRNRISRPI